MAEVFAAAGLELTVNEIIQRMSDELGYNVSDTRFSNMVKRNINSTLQDIQLHDPHNRRTMVTDAVVTLKRGVVEYDVRKDVSDGGWGWTNCYEVIQVVVHPVSSRPLEQLEMRQWRNRSYLESDTGPGYALVMVDQVRMRIHPPPDQDYIGVGEYTQNFPKIDAGDDSVDWPRAWDQVLMEGTRFHMYRAEYNDRPGLWMPQRDHYFEVRRDWVESERANPRLPKRGRASRDLRSRRFLSRDNSRDYRWSR